MELLGKVVLFVLGAPAVVCILVALRPEWFSRWLPGGGSTDRTGGGAEIDRSDGSVGVGEVVSSGWSLTRIRVVAFVAALALATTATLLTPVLLRDDACRQARQIFRNAGYGASHVDYLDQAREAAIAQGFTFELDGVTVTLGKDGRPVARWTVMQSRRNRGVSDGLCRWSVLGKGP